MAKEVINVVNLSKSYQIGSEKSGDLRSTLSNWWKQFRTTDKKTAQTFWALKDVSFSVKQGEVFGIIGANGAGKSTLLKILSSITKPTSGYAELTGRVASLLEVGTGFHPELTGRENIFLNGALLGMKRQEIKDKFDEIVEFSGVNKFIDTPVKHYSSGMYVRLAFAVAAHLEPEILLVDEVLAVGDAAFQKKCLGKLGEVANSGRTVIFVSHDLGSIQQLCSKGIFLNRGRLEYSGEIFEVIGRYLNRSSITNNDFSNRKDFKGNGLIKVVNIKARSQNGVLICAGDPIDLIFEYQSERDDFQPVNVSFILICKNYIGNTVFLCNTNISHGAFLILPSQGEVICHIPKLGLNKGIYTFDLYTRVNDVDSFVMLNAFEIEVMSGAFYQTGKLPINRQGVLIDYEWSLNKKGS